MSSTESRLAAVERQLRFHRAVIAALLVALVALVGYGATQGVPEEIRARKFVVLNEEGREVVVIDSWELGGWITTYPGKGDYLPSISLAHTDDGGGLLELFNKDGGRGVQLQGMNNVGGGGGVVVANKSGKAVVSALANPDGNGGFGVYNKNGKGGFSATSKPDGNGLLGVSNKHGNPVILASASPEGGLLEVYNKDDKRVVVAGANPEGNGAIGVYNKEGKDGVQLRGMNKLGSGGSVLVINKTGEIVTSMGADEYGMGVVGAFDRQRKGRTLTPR